MPLTADRAKPAVPFAGIYRLIDYAMSNVVNSGYLQVVVLTQYKSHSLDRHVTQTRRLSTMLGNYVTPVPAQQRVGKHWYLGSADAIYQSPNLIKDEKPDIVVVVGADNIYRMDFSQMVDQHVETGAACTVAAIRQPIGLADQFGVIDVQPDDPRRIREFLEKPKDATGLPDNPQEVLASMGNYVFDADALVGAVARDSSEVNSKHDMGGDIVPSFVRRNQAGVYDFRDNKVPGATDATAATGATWGRSALLRTWIGVAAAGVQPLQLRLADLHLLRTRSRPRRSRRARTVRSTMTESLLSPGVVVGGGQISLGALARPCSSAQAPRSPTRC